MEAAGQAVKRKHTEEVTHTVKRECVEEAPQTVKTEYVEEDPHTVKQESVEDPQTATRKFGHGRLQLQITETSLNQKVPK